MLIKRGKILVIFLIVLIIAVVIGIAIYFVLKDTKTLSKQYTNQEFNFKFGYPEEWKIIENELLENNIEIYLSNENKFNMMGIYVNKLEAEFTLKEAKDRYVLQYQAVLKKEIEEEMILFNGKKVYKLSNENLPITIIAKNNDKLFVITIINNKFNDNNNNKDLETANLVLKSFEFI